MRTTIIVSCALTGVAGLACLVLLVAQPYIRELLFADAVALPTGLLAALALQVILSAAAGGFIIAAKARRDGAVIARSRFASTLAGVALVAAAAVMFGVEGAAWATAGQAAVYLACLAVFSCRAQRRRQVRYDELEPVDVRK
jgi:O-antigen/teichoic acid export membrane protein